MPSVPASVRNEQRNHLPLRLYPPTQDVQERLHLATTRNQRDLDVDSAIETDLPKGLADEVERASHPATIVTCIREDIDEEFWRLGLEARLGHCGGGQDGSMGVLLYSYQ